ncbi:hypothetical protein AHAS_Ahas03G0010400 [Arachis hypogaea]
MFWRLAGLSTASPVSPVALFPKRHKIAPRCHHHHPDPSMLLWKRVHFHNASGLLTRFLPRRSQHHSSADADAVVVTRDLPNRNRRLPLRFCVWVALKFESLVDQHFRNEVSCTLATKEWCSLYWDALQLLKKSEIFISSESVRALIRTYSYMGLAEEAIQCFDRMSEFDCEPDAHAYNTILKVVLKKDLFVLAFSLYNVMLRSNSLPDDHTYTLLIGGFCKIGNFNAALEMLDDMSKRGVLPDVKTYTAIIYGLCQWKKVDEAFRLFNTMKENGCLPTLRCYNVLIDGFCKNGRTDEALSLLSLLRIDGFALNLQSYCSLINSFIHAKRYSEAYVWYTKMFKRGIVPDVTLYAIMIRGLSEEGRVGEAAKMLDEMIGMGLVPDAYCYNALIKGFCDIGRLDQARSLQLEVSKDEQFHNAYTYTILICGMCRNGMVGEAREIFNQMEKLGCLPSVVTFSALMHGLCKARRIEEAHLLLHEMEIGRSPSLFFRLSQGSDRVFDSVSLQKKVEQMCEAGEVLNAYKLLKQLAGSGVVPNIITYNILINGFCKTGNINAAIKLFKELQLKGISPDSITYGTLVDGLYRANREDDAFKIREHMLKHGCQPGLSNSNAHMSWLNKKGKVSMAFNLYFEYLKSLPRWDNDSINVLENHFIRGNVKEVIRGLLEMDFKCRDFNLAPYTILITGFCMAKKVDEALAIFSVLGEFNININPTSCVHLIDILCEEGKLDDAVNIFLYTLEKSFMLRPRICNKLLKCLLLSIDKKDYAIDLVDRMQSHGYCLNSHQYDKAMYITDGERLTLTLWFTRDGSHDEDVKLVSLLSQHLLHKDMAASYLPLPASCDMYCFSQDQASNDQFGFNICWARLHSLGYGISISEDGACDSDVSELLVKPVQLVRGDELLDHEFVNILHALQVIHFYCWQGSALKTKALNVHTNVLKLSDKDKEKINCLKSVLLNDEDLVLKVFGSMPLEENGGICFDWTGIVAAIAAWEDYGKIM